MAFDRALTAAERKQLSPFPTRSRTCAAPGRDAQSLQVRAFVHEGEHVARDRIGQPRRTYIRDAQVSGGRSSSPRVLPIAFQTTRPTDVEQLFALRYVDRPCLRDAPLYKASGGHRSPRLSLRRTPARLARHAQLGQQRPPPPSAAFCARHSRRERRVRPDRHAGGTAAFSGEDATAKFATTVV